MSYSEYLQQADVGGTVGSSSVRTSHLCLNEYTVTVTVTVTVHPCHSNWHVCSTCGPLFQSAGSLSHSFLSSFYYDPQFITIATIFPAKSDLVLCCRAFVFDKTLHTYLPVYNACKQRS